MTFSISCSKSQSRMSWDWFGGGDRLFTRLEPRISIFHGLARLSYPGSIQLGTVIPRQSFDDPAVVWEGELLLLIFVCANRVREFVCISPSGYWTPLQWIALRFASRCFWWLRPKFINEIMFFSIDLEAGMQNVKNGDNEQNERDTLCHRREAPRVQNGTEGDKPVKCGKTWQTGQAGKRHRWNRKRHRRFS